LLWRIWANFTTFLGRGRLVFSFNSVIMPLISWSVLGCLIEFKFQILLVDL
jgi:hypothetical protein